MNAHPDLPPIVSAAVDVWLDEHDQIDAGVVEGLYVIGSAAFGDWWPGSDIDVVAFVAHPTDGDVVVQLEAAHQAFESDDEHPTVDGPYLSWADVSSPPLAALRPWTLDGEFHFDGDCFEINPVTWFVLATHGIAVRGDPAANLAVHVDEADRRQWVRENVDTYWRGVHDQILSVLAEEPERDEFDAGMTEWCALGIARVAYTFDTADVTSKTAAGEWLVERRPTHSAVLRRALAVRRDSSAAVVDRADVLAVVDLLHEEVLRITGS